MTKHWYQIGDTRKKLSWTEAKKIPEAVMIICPQCIYELETGESAIDIHKCDVLSQLLYGRRRLKNLNKQTDKKNKQWIRGEFK